MATGEMSLEQIDEMYGYPCGRPEDICKPIGAVTVSSTFESRDRSRGWGNKMVGGSLYDVTNQISDVA
jgi:hypothetical protein